MFGPALDFAGNQFADFADKQIIPFIDSIAAEMRGIWDPNSDDDLQQRLDRTGNILRDRLGPVWSDLKRDLDQADLGDKLADAFSDAFPVIAETAGRGGGRATIAFIKGWWHSAWWAKLLTFAFIAGKLGALTPLGKWAGKRFVAAMAPRMAAMLGVQMAAEGAVGGAVVGKMKPLGRVAGLAFATAFIAAAPLTIAALFAPGEVEEFLPYPELVVDDPNVPEDIQALAERIEAVLQNGFEDLTIANIKLDDGTCEFGDDCEIHRNSADVLRTGDSFQIGVDLRVEGDSQLLGALDHDGAGVGFYGSAPVAKPTVTGSRGGNAALADLLTELATMGLITNSSTA